MAPGACFGSLVTVTESHVLDGLCTTKTCFSQFYKLEVQGQGAGRFSPE